MPVHTFPLTWDLGVFFKGGSNSPALAKHLEALKENYRVLEKEIDAFIVPTHLSEATTILTLFQAIEENSQNLTQAAAFIGCLQAQNTKDKKASLLMGDVVSLYAVAEKITTSIEVKLTKIEDSLWVQLLQTPPLNEISFVLNEIREHALEKLSFEQEALISSLAVDGYHGWGQMYDTVVGNITITHEGKELSVGQAYNLFSVKDNGTRKTVFDKWEKAWKEQSEYLAKILNHLAGFRLSIYEARGWKELLKEPLNYNRMSQETLDAMWTAINENKAPFVSYLQRKASLLGLDGLSWYDQEAPIGESERKIAYQEGAEFILKHFGHFGEELKNFTQHALENSWIEAEDRPNKRPGGFCTTFPLQEESRIFMTYSGSPSTISTLAHELGHAFHTHTLKDVHPLNKHYAMNVAETASTFAEMIVSDAAVKSANTKQERIALLENKIQGSIAFYMNIHARFLFETRFYEERKNGMVSAERLCTLMEEAQQEAFCGSLKEYHPHFWASKLHFFITDVPFYNFPYTFGYLFSLGIYAQAIKEGINYEEKYIALLQDTGCMTVEELAQKHLDVDLSQKDFWENAVKLSIKDVEEFLQLTN